MVFKEIHESVCLQPLIDMLSTMSDLGNLKLPQSAYGDEGDLPRDRINFEKRKFQSLGSLDLKLAQTKTAFHLVNSFTFSNF